MNGETQEYIHDVKVEDIPWHRITTTYGRATDFPKYFEILLKMEDLDASRCSIMHQFINAWFIKI